MKAIFKVLLIVIGGFFLITIIGLLIGIGKHSPSHSNIETNPKEVYKTKIRDEMDAYVETQLYIKDQLKSPATAEFGGSESENLTRLSDSSFSIQGYVDSQNSFGGLMRADYACVVTYTPDDSFHCFMVQFQQR